MSKALETVVDARRGQHVLITGKQLRVFLQEQISRLRTEYTRLLARINNEITSKEDAVGLMIAIAGEKSDLNERALFFLSCVERAAFLQNEIRELTTIGHTYSDSTTYRITTKDAMRYGVGNA